MSWKALKISVLHLSRQRRWTGCDNLRYRNILGVRKSEQSELKLSWLPWPGAWAALPPRSAQACGALLQPAVLTTAPPQAQSEL